MPKWTTSTYKWTVSTLVVSNLFAIFCYFYNEHTSSVHDTHTHEFEQCDAEFQSITGTLTNDVFVIPNKPFKDMTKKELIDLINYYTFIYKDEEIKRLNCFDFEKFSDYEKELHSFDVGA